MVKTTEHKIYSKKDISKELMEELKEDGYTIYEDKQEGILVDNEDDCELCFKVEKNKFFTILEVEHIPEKDDDEDEDDLFYNINGFIVEYGQRRLFVFSD